MVFTGGFHARYAQTEVRGTFDNLLQDAVLSKSVDNFDIAIKKWRFEVNKIWQAE